MKKICRSIFVMLQISLLLFLIGGCTSTTSPSPTDPVAKDSTPAATNTKISTKTPTSTQTITIVPTPLPSWRALGAVSKYISALAVDPKTPNRVYAASHSAIYLSIYGGEYWYKVYSYTTTSKEDVINTILIDPQNPDIVYAGIYNHGVIKSTNGGETWNPANNGLYNQKIVTLEMDPTNSEQLYAGSDAGLFVSSNAGTSWKLVNSSLAPYKIKAIGIDPDHPEVLYVGTSVNGLFKSKDAGSTWQEMNNGLTIPDNEQERLTWIHDLAINPLNPQILYVAGNGIYKSIDGAETWEAQNIGFYDWDGSTINVAKIQFNPISPNTLYIEELMTFILRSTDEGVNWELFDTNLHDPITAIAFDPIDANVLYVGTDQFGAYTTRMKHLPYPTPTKTPYECSQGWTHLKVGGYAYVTGDATSAYNRVRYAPDLSSESFARIYPGMVVSIIEGPQCSNGMVFWKVRHKNIQHGGGWTAEGNFHDRWLESYP